jgi:hypothetical protein
VRLWVSRVLCMLLLATGMGIVALDPASAGPCRWEFVKVTAPGGRLVDYVRTKVGCTGTEVPGEGATGGSPIDTPGGGGPVSPGCDLVSPATFCFGPYPCYYEKGVFPWEPPATPPPTPGADYRVRLCLGPRLLIAPEWVVTTPEPPTLVERSQAAFGQLVVPPATLAFNPTRRTLVNLDTWFWAQGLTGQPIRGTSALGLVAVATPVGVQVTPGDGSGSFSCPWVTSKSDLCAHVYRRSSVGGSARGPDGGPAYQASAEATWNVHFEQDGAPMPIPGAPTKLTGRLAAAVEVAEVQTVVTWSR